MPTGVTRRRRRLRAGDSALAAGTVATRPPAQDLERARRFHAGKPGLQPAETHRTACATSAEAETSRYSTPRAEPRVSIPRWAGSCLLGDVLRPSAANFFVATARTPLVILARSLRAVARRESDDWGSVRHLVATMRELLDRLATDYYRDESARKVVAECLAGPESA